MTRFLSLTEADREEMLEAIGVTSLDELFEQIPRGGMPILEGGEVTSGTHSPMLGTGIGLGYVPADLAAPGSQITIDVRGRARRARVVKKPIYKRED